MKKVFLICLLWGLGCKSPVYRHNIDSSIPEEQLVKFFTWNADIKSIDDKFVNIPYSLYGRVKEFFLSEGKHTIDVKFVEGKLKSNGSKKLEVDAKAGEVYMVCSISTAQNETFVGGNFTGTWTTFLIKVEKRNMDSGEVYAIYKDKCTSKENMEKLNTKEKK